MGQIKVRVTVTRLTALRASTRGKSEKTIDNHFIGLLYKLNGNKFRTSNYLTILDQKACVLAVSLEDAFSTDPARILVYDENGARQIETSEIIDYRIDKNSALVNTENYRYEVIAE